jgi:hypothetical protein
MRSPLPVEAERLVVNTGPLIALGRVDAFDIIGRLPMIFIIPKEVADEIEAGARAGYPVAIPAWATVQPLKTAIEPLGSHLLDAGEAAVIQLAIEQSHRGRVHRRVAWPTSRRCSRAACDWFARSTRPGQAPRPHRNDSPLDRQAHCVRRPLPSRSSSALSSGDRRVAERRSRPRCCLGRPSVAASGSLEAGNLGA